MQIDIEQEESITYTLINSLEPASVLFKYVFYQLPYTRDGKYSLSQALKKLTFLTEEQSLYFIFSSPFDLADIVLEADKFNLNFLSTVCIQKETTFRPDYNFSSKWHACTLFYSNNFTPFEDYLSDFYISTESFLSNLFKCLPSSKSVINTLLLKSPDPSLNVFDDETIFRLSQVFSCYLYQN